MHKSRDRNVSVLQKLTMIFCCSVLPLSAYAITFQGPLVVNDTYVKTHGNVISGNYQGTLTQPAISVSSKTAVTIINSTVQGPGDLIYTLGGNVQVVNTTGTSTNPNVLNQQKGMFVHAEKPVNIYVANCTATGPSYGVYVNGYAGNFTHTQTIQVYNNVFNNIDGRPSDGKGGYATSGQWSTHAVHFDNVQAVPNMEIAWNEVINVPRQSQSNVLVSVLNTSGTSTSHLIVHDNYLQGAYPANPGKDSYSGGGIITDGGSTDTVETATSFVDIYNNQVVSTANYGIDIAAGHDINVYNNRVISSGFLADGSFIPMTYSNGMNNWNEYNQPATVFYNNIMQNNNPVGLIASTSGTNTPRRSDWWLPGQTTSGNNVSYTPNDTAHPTIAAEANELVLWGEKLKKNKIQIGVKK